jgi:aryl-alcohol dehydrogenase-like predicted oxidoreductase
VPYEAERIATIHAALDAGIALLDTGDDYGAGHNELLIGRALRDRRGKAFLSVARSRRRRAMFGRTCRVSPVRTSSGTSV